MSDERCPWCAATIETYAQVQVRICIPCGKSVRECKCPFAPSTAFNIAPAFGPTPKGGDERYYTPTYARSK